MQQQQNQDEWGDFQEIQTVKKEVVSVSVHDQGGGDGDDDDEEEFSDFVAPSQMIGSRLASIQDESPVHNFKKPKIVSQQNNDQNHPQNWPQQPSPVFADFQGLSLSSPPNVLPKVGNDVTNTIGKKYALKKYDQFTLNTSCFWGKYIPDQILPQ